MAQAKRKDKARTVLKTGEGQRSNGTYYYRWQDKKGNRHYLYAKSLSELREKEKEVEKDKFDGIKIEARYVTVNDLYELWKQMKRGLKNNTFENYTYGRSRRQCESHPGHSWPSGYFNDHEHLCGCDEGTEEKRV